MPLLPYRGVWPTIAEDAFIAPTAVIAGDVTIASGASVWFGVVIRGDSAPVRIGPRSNIQDQCAIHTDADAPCIIGADCTLGHGAIVHGATLGDGVLVGMHATVLSRARVGSGCIIAAGALVPEGQQIEAGQLLMGVPAKVIRPTTDAERVRALNSAQHYVDFAREYARSLKSEPPQRES